MNRNYSYSKSSLANIETTSEYMQAICHRAMKLANVRKMECPDFGISSGLRTAKEQKELFKRGRDAHFRVMYQSLVVTNCDGVANISDHQEEYIDKEAIDFFCINPNTGKSDYRSGPMALVATLFFEAASDLGESIDWGGSYKSISDGAHITRYKKPKEYESQP